jgi:hypothetical protein
MINLRDSDAPHLLKIENAILVALRPFNNGDTEGAIAALACIRVAKQILQIYPDSAKIDLLPTMAAYLMDKPLPGTEAQARQSQLWTPPAFGPLGGNGRK